MNVKENNQVICALATPAGSGALAIIRIAGEGSIALVDNIFKAKSNKKLADSEANKIIFGEIYDGSEVLDEVLVTVFRAPHSYTGEDAVEISSHGSPYIRQRILQLLTETGGTLALPGEFTQRAFLNGKLDLSQAEAVADLIASSSSASHRMAINQIKGGFSSELHLLREQMLQLISLLELELDFAEEDVDFADRSQLLQLSEDIHNLIKRLSDSFSVGNVIKNGIPVAIVGNTNVGKSTLLNALLNEERAIVSDIAGTTRDTIEDTVNLGGNIFRFIDTAGIRSTDDAIETIGIKRTFDKISKADIVLLITDLSSDFNTFEEYYKQVKGSLHTSATLLILLNKVDVDFEEADKWVEAIKRNVFLDEVLPISAKTGYNLPILIEKLIDIVNRNIVTDSDVIVSNVRHYEALIRAKSAIERAIGGLRGNISNEFIIQDIRECLHYIGEITGDITTDEILGNIFGKFCIGK
ncbi:MAG: tRNA uridine-5-carboxymethylaminomethyl(34) synthesis GTPase MnmE [Culturomica sp.]|jgi:tRNA modification GTPase|nr:tRNA uridine-5-carboxymethylaminomethyl(34) synthesis GTPase MnmE [Culturomica sp.]